MPTRRNKVQRRTVLVDDLDIQVIGVDGSPLRHLTLDATRNHQPLGHL
jgi:hypothetical protein